MNKMQGIIKMNLGIATLNNSTLIIKDSFYRWLWTKALNRMAY